MQAAEAALRQQGLHRSAGDFEMLLRTFLAVQRRAGLLEGDAPPPPGTQLLQLPTRQPQRRGPRRIPGLGRSL